MPIARMQSPSLERTGWTRPGQARTAGIAMGAAALLLAGGLVVVVKHYLSTPAATAGTGETPSANGGGATAIRPVSEVLEEARRAMGAHEYAKAETVLRKAIEGSPMDQELRLAVCEALVAQEKFADAYAQYERAILIGPKSAKLHFLAGTVAAKAQMPDRAEEQYSMAQALDMRDPDIPLYLAMVQVKQQKNTAAAASLLRAIKLKPERAEAWGTLAELYFADDKPGVALPNAEKARELQPQEPRWRIVEAKILNRENQPEKAATSLLALNAEERQKPEVLKVLAASYGMMGKPQDAAAMYAQAAASEAGRGNAELNYEAALWFERAKDAAGAAKYAKIAAMLGNEDAREMAERLGRP